MNKTARDIILKPLITEKSVGGLTQNKYTFKVLPQANKIEIKKAIEDIFKVKVVKVNTCRVKGKVRYYRRIMGRTADWKKAIVTLRPGDKIVLKGIELFEQ